MQCIFISVFHYVFSMFSLKFDLQRTVYAKRYIKKKEKITGHKNMFRENSKR